MGLLRGSCAALAAVLLSLPASPQCELPALDQRGLSLAARDGLVLFGDPDGSGTQTGTGVARLLVSRPGGWGEEGLLEAPGGASGDQFGHAVALGHRVALCGAPGADGARGAVQVFELGSGGWVPTQRLVAAGGQPGDQFGYSLDLSGEVLVVGAPRIVFADADPDGGSAHVFERSSGGWVEVATLGVPGNPSNGFGLAVAAAADTVVVGRPGFPLFSTSHDHDARVYERQAGGTWTHVQTLTGSDPIYQHDDEFGSALDMYAGRLVVGAAQDSGFAYIFERGDQGWEEVLELGSLLSGSYFFLGRAVALDGERVLVGAPSTFQNPAARAFAFERGPGGWQLDTEFRRSATDAEPLGFGHSLAIVAGQVWAPSGDGGGRIYRFAERAGESYCTSSPNSSGGAARIELSAACASIAAGQLTLVAAPVPDTSGLFLLGNQPSALPFGAGVRCVAGSVVRLPLQGISAGALSFDLDLSTLPAGGVVAGDTRYFQAWFRDAPGFDLSDGLRVGFTP